jgi:hypothetical protein
MGKEWNEIGIMEKKEGELVPLSLSVSLILPSLATQQWPGLPVGGSDWLVVSIRELQKFVVFSEWLEILGDYLHPCSTPVWPRLSKVSPSPCW